MPRARAAARWRAKLPVPKAGAIESGSVPARRLVPPSRVAGTSTSGARCSVSTTSRISSERQERHVAGHDENARPPLFLQELQALPDGGVRPLFERVVADDRPVALCQRGGLRVGGDDEDAGERRRAGQHGEDVVQHRAHQLGALGGVRAVASRCLAWLRRFTGTRAQGRLSSTLPLMA